jgi:hypothetical protein
VHDGAIARISGDDVTKSVLLPGGYPRTEPSESRRTPLAALSEEERARVRAIDAWKRCACPLCEAMRSEYSNPPVRTRSGARAERIETWPSSWPWRWIPGGPREALWAVDASAGSPMLYVTSDGGVRFRRAYFPEVDRGALSGALATVDEGFLAIVTSANESRWFRSRDGGRTWHAADPGEVPEGRIDAVATRRSPTHDLVAWRNEDAEATVFASSDDGRTWRRLLFRSRPKADV